MAAFVPDVVCLAATPSTLPEHIRPMCLQTTTLLVEVLNHIASLNEEVDFQAATQISDRLGPRKVAPEGKEKERFTEKLGLHLLRLPRWWRPVCLQSPEERHNSTLHSQLRQLWPYYWALEAALSVIPTPS